MQITNLCGIVGILVDTKHTRSMEGFKLKTIELSKGLSVIVDADDYLELSKHNWYASESKKNYFYATRSGYANGNRTTIKMHREILGVSGDFEVDHINHNTLDNRKANLRITSRSDNHKNSKLQTNNKTGVCGVIFKDGRYKANIKENGKQRYLGSFVDLNEAAKARKEAEKKYCFHENHGKKFNDSVSL